MINLITLQEYKLAKGISKGDEDQILEQLITSVSSLIQRYINRDFNDSIKTVTETISLDYDTNAIYLDNYPVNEIVSLTEIDPYGYDSSVHFPVPLTTYRLDSADGVLIRTPHNKYWPQGYGAVQVTYTTGSASGTIEIPADLKQVAIDMVTYYRKEEWKESRAMRGATMSNEPIYSSSTKWPPHIQRVLDLYK